MISSRDRVILPGKIDIDLPEYRSIRLVVLIRQPILRQGIVALCMRRCDLEVVGEWDDSGSAVELYYRFRPDVLLMEIGDCDREAFSEITTLRLTCPDSRVIVFDAHDTAEALPAAIRAGAMGFLPASAPFPLFVEALKAVHAGRRYIPPSPGGRTRRGADLCISERERDVLNELAKGKTNSAIADALCISEATVKFHVHQILRRMGCRNRTQAVALGLKCGLITAL